MSLARRAVLLAILAYQRILPRTWRGHCRFAPSCSDYARQAIEKHGLWRGARLAVGRILRCHPFGAHGLDPVP
jgi:putative membrane protein insertion efficiency factor